MKGKILAFDELQNKGVISSDDGKRYEFQGEQWKGGSKPKPGAKVDFEITENLATGIYLDSSAGQGSSKKIAAALFAFFLGSFGAHKFYLGYTKQGIIMLVVFLLGFVLVGIPSMIIGLIAFVEFIIYLTKSDEDFEQTYVIGRKGWF